MVKPTYLLSLAALSAATPLLDTRATCGEGPDRVCYSVSGGESQHLDPNDIQYATDYLRNINDNNQGSAKFWNMPRAIDCAEWSLPLPAGGSVLALAKHINPRINSAILYEDVTAAINGGLNAPDSVKQKALFGCSTNGGQFGVTANLSNPLYNTDEYKKTSAKPEGIIVKLIKAPKSG